MHQPAWLFPSLLSSAPLTPKGSTPGTSPPHPHLPHPFHTSTHPHHTSAINLSTPQPNHPRSHLPRSPPLLCRVVWDTLVQEDTGGQERDPGEVVRWRIRCSLPTASVPLPLSNLLILTQRCLAHTPSGNGYSQTVAFCPQMDPPPISPSPPPTSGWLGATPAAGRGEGIHVCVGGAGLVWY